MDSKLSCAAPNSPRRCCKNLRLVLVLPWAIFSKCRINERTYLLGILKLTSATRSNTGSESSKSRASRSWLNGIIEVMSCRNRWNRFLWLEKLLLNHFQRRQSRKDHDHCTQPSTPGATRHTSSHPTHEAQPTFLLSAQAA